MEGITSVPTLSMAGMAVSMLVSLAATVAAFLFGRKKLGASISSFFVGVGTFTLFAMVLESLMHNLIYVTPVGQKIWSNTWLYALYGGAAASSPPGPSGAGAATPPTLSCTAPATAASRRCISE